MKVLLPSETTHTITIIPRFYPTTTLSMDISNELLETTVTVVPTYSISNGIMSITFDLEGVEQDRFVYKVTESSNLVSMGKLFFTEQETQDFKLTKDTYIYAE